jgi:hypothetical protein
VPNPSIPVPSVTGSIVTVPFVPTAFVGNATETALFVAPGAISPVVEPVAFALPVVPATDAIGFSENPSARSLLVMVSERVPGSPGCAISAGIEAAASR